MDALKALVASKRKSAEEEFKGKEYAKRSEIEELRLAKLREEEQREREAKVGARAPASPAAVPQASRQPAVLSLCSLRPS